jgi:hypothetical protein
LKFATYGTGAARGGVAGSVGVAAGGGAVGCGAGTGRRLRPDWADATATTTSIRARTANVRRIGVRFMVEYYVR